MKRNLTTLLMALAVTGPALADQVVSDDLIVVEDLLCVGTKCEDGESEIPDRQGLKIKDFAPGILFEDLSDSPFPNNDWAIDINGTTSASSDFFGIRDVTGAATPFRLMGGAPENAMVIGSNGNIGFGTLFPAKEMHIAGDSITAIRIDALTDRWELRAASGGHFAIRDGNSNTAPFLIEDGAEEAAMHIAVDGDIGLGTDTPEGKLHTEGDGVQLVYFESTDGGPVQVRFRSDSENRRFLATNNADEVQSQVIFKNDEILFTGTTDRGADRWMSISQAGLVTQGPSCDPGPCDRTFDPSYFTVPPIAERAAVMWENKHLPAVGPTSPDAPFNLTQKAGGMLHELEVAHIYIEQLHEAQSVLSDRVAQQQADIAQLRALVSELIEKQ